MILRLIVLAALIGATVAMTGWLRGVQEELQRAVGAADPATPDYTFGDVTLTHLGPSGNPAWRIKAPRLAHFEARNRARLVSPRAWLYREQGPPFHLRAEHAWILNGGEEIELAGAVDITRPAHGERPALRVDTREVLVQPVPGTAQTREPVRAVHGGHRLRGLGMRLDVKADTLQIPKRARGIYAP